MKLQVQAPLRVWCCSTIQGSVPKQKAHKQRGTQAKWDIGFPYKPAVVRATTCKAHELQHMREQTLASSTAAALSLQMWASIAWCIERSRQCLLQNLISHLDQFHKLSVCSTAAEKFFAVQLLEGLWLGCRQLQLIPCCSQVILWVPPPLHNAMLSREQPFTPQYLSRG